MTLRVATAVGVNNIAENGTTDFTAPGLGPAAEIQAALVISNSDESGTGANNIISSVGMWDAVSDLQLVNTKFANDGTSTGNIAAGHVAQTGAVVKRTTANNTDIRVLASVDSPIDDGIRIRTDSFGVSAGGNPNSPRAIPIGAFIFAGADVRAEVVNITASLVAGDTREHEIRFSESVDLIIAMGDGDQYNTDPHAAFSTQSMSFHAFRNGVKQSAAQTIGLPGFNAQLSPIPAQAYGRVSTNGHHLQTDPGRQSEVAVAWEFDIQVVGDRVRITTVVAGDDPQPPEIGLMILHLADKAATAGLMTPPASGQNAPTFSTDVTDAEAMILQLGGFTSQSQDTTDGSPNLAVNGVNTAEAGAFGVAFASTIGDSISQVSSWEVGANPTNATTLSTDGLSILDDEGTTVLEGLVSFAGSTPVVNTTLNSAPNNLLLPYLAIVPRPQFDVEEALTEVMECQAETKTTLAAIQATLAALPQAVDQQVFNDLDGTPVIQAIVDRIGNMNVDESALALAIRNDLERADGVLAAIAESQGTDLTAILNALAPCFRDGDTIRVTVDGVSRTGLHEKV